MIRKIIHIDEEKCNGCGLCADACHEGAIDIVDGKAKLVRENFCDGFGDCLPNCPAGAISFEEREAPAYDEAAVKASQMKSDEMNASQVKANEMGAGKMTANEIKAMQEKISKEGLKIPHAGCPGSKAREIQHGPAAGMPHGAEVYDPADGAGVGNAYPQISELVNWPVQIKLAPVKAGYFEGAKLLIAADCTAYAYVSFHKDFIKGRVALIGCPKLDAVDYSEKLTEIIRENDIKSVTIVRMEVPCCGGLEHAAKTALMQSGKFIPWQVVTIGIDGTILDR